jgi:hypothetical protein
MINFLPSKKIMILMIVAGLLNLLMEFNNLILMPNLHMISHISHPLLTLKLISKRKQIKIIIIIKSNHLIISIKLLIGKVYQISLIVLKTQK